MEFRTRPGRKGPGDEIIEARTVSEIEKGPWEQLKMRDVGTAVVLLAKNEDTLAAHNPHWHRKGKKIIDYLRDCERYGQRSADVRHKLAEPEFDWFNDGGETAMDIDD